MSHVPTFGEVQDWSQLDFVDLGICDQLERLVAQAVAYVEQVTGRVPLRDVPPELELLMQQAVTMRTEQVVLDGTAGSVSSQADDSGVQSFTVPGYSETRFDRSSSEVNVKGNVTNRWKALWDVLWLLMTPEKREEWTAAQNGAFAPASAVQEYDYDAVGYVLPTSWDLW